MRFYTTLTLGLLCSLLFLSVIQVSADGDQKDAPKDVPKDAPKDAQKDAQKDAPVKAAAYVAFVPSVPAANLTKDNAQSVAEAWNKQYDSLNTTAGATDTEKAANKATEQAAVKKYYGEITNKDAQKAFFDKLNKDLQAAANDASHVGVGIFGVAFASCVLGALVL